MQKTKYKQVEVCCPSCLSYRTIQYNPTRYALYPKNNEGVSLQRCKPCSTKELIDQRLKDGFFNDFSKPPPTGVRLTKPRSERRKKTGKRYLTVCNSKLLA